MPRRFATVLLALCAITIVGVPAAGLGVQSASRIGYLGGSLTVNAVDGYFAVGGRLLWVGNDSAYGGGTITAWAAGIANPSDARWQAFQTMAADHPNTSRVWVQLLAHQDLAPNPQAARQVVIRVKQLLPTARVHVSAMNGYTDYRLVTCTTPQAVAQMRAIAARLVADGHALAGPDVADLDPATQTRDNCHANSTGKLILGQRLLAFFG